MADMIFHPDFKTRPYWWDAYAPTPLPEIALPRDIPVLIVGAGYAGISAAIELNRAGIDCLVIDAEEPGFGGSTRNGGMVSGGVNVGKGLVAPAPSPEEVGPLLSDAAEAFDHIDTLIAREGIDCGWTKSGYFLGAWCRSHFDGMAKKIGLLNGHARSEARIVPEDQQRAEIGSDYYRGGMVIERAAHLHPALYYKGLLGIAARRGIAIASRTPALRINPVTAGFSVETPRGTIHAGHVIIATNGYTGDATPGLKRRVVPVNSYIIATEELPDGLAAAISPQNRSFADTRRMLSYYRLSPDGKRLIFGGRAKYAPVDPREAAPILYQFMTDRFPDLRGIRITHAWTGNVAFTIDEVPHMGLFEGLHYALGCNGSGVAMMTWLGYQTARKIVGGPNRINAFDRPTLPSHPLYRGDPWFLPMIGAWFQAKDWIDRRFN